MPPKKAPSKQKATAQPQAAATAGAKRSTTKGATKKAPGRATAQSEYPSHDNYDDYRQWVRRADKDDPEVSLSTIHEEWSGLPADSAAAFAGAVRAFRNEEDVRTAAQSDLRKVLQRLSEFQYSDERSDRRRIGKEAGSLYHDLVLELEVWQSTTEDVLSQLDAVENALAEMPQEGLHALLETYHKGLREQIHAAYEKIGSWIEEIQQVPHDGLWTLESIQMVQNSANDIEIYLATAASSSRPPSGRSSSSPKRKRQDDIGKRSPKAPRRTENHDVVGSGSAKGGATRSQQRFSGLHEMGQNAEQANSAGPVNQNRKETTGSQRSTPDVAPGASTRMGQPPSDPPDATQPRDAAPNAPTGQSPAILQPPPLPTVGRAGQWTQMLQRDMSDVSLQTSLPSFMAWCRRQFIKANYNTLDECEPLAAAVYALFERVLRDHDWENESDMPPMPMSSRDAYNFKLGAGDGHMWGNLRRLFRILSRPDAPLMFLEYCRRNWTPDGFFVDNADSIAHDILQLVNDKGLSHDWENENDVAVNVPSTKTTTANFPLENLILNGHWNFHLEIAAGGNGRALLYCKYDSAGNLLRRVISKESFIGNSWNLPPLWSGAVASRTPIEAGIHRLFPRNPHIIEYLGFHVNKQLRMIRHYTAFADFGDLESLYDNHAKLSNAVDEHGVALTPPPIPVVAIMYMFQAMAAGACLMAHGAVPDDQGRWPGNQPPAWPHDIIHRDIKPRNYFISSSESSVLWPKLPIAALGDFGNAFDAVSLMGAGRSHRMGTETYMAPEQLPNYRTIFTVTPATNVYQIGVAILQLMHLQLPRLQADFDTEEQDPVFPSFSADATFYPQALIDLAEDCVQPVPRDRPTPVDLYLQIRDLASGYPDESNKEIPWQLQTVPPNQRVRNNIDRWAV